MSPLKLYSIILSASVLSACGGSSVVPVTPPTSTDPLPSSIAASSVPAVNSSSAVTVSSIRSSSVTSSIPVVVSSSSVRSTSASSTIIVSSSTAVSVSSSSVVVTPISSSSIRSSSSSSRSATSVSSTSTSSVPNVTADVKAAAGTKDSRLACYKSAGEKACDLRTYQVMVEAFVDGDGNINMNTGYGTSHHKGDIQGVINSLDYIKSLGVNTVWLTPVFNSTAGKAPTQMDATGYFASNFFDVDPYFGSKQKLKELVDTAHAKGLYVLLDGVFGHAKSDAGNFASPTGKKVTGSTGSFPYPENLEFFKEVATYWVTEYKIDGWRLDQAYQVPVQYWTEIRKAVEDASAAVSYENSAGQMVKPLGYMVGEIWRGEAEIKAQGYGATATPALLSLFDFPLRYRLVQTLAVEESGLGKSPATNLRAGYATHATYPDYAMPNLMLTNHDLLRFGDLIQRGGIATPSDDQYWLRHKAAMSFMAAYSGPITLYYGDEIGQEVPNFAAKVDNGVCSSQGKCDDHVSRDSGVVEGVTGTNVLTPKQVDLKNYVASALKLRDTHPALWNGSRTHIFSDARVYIDRKDAGSDHILYALNTTNAEVKISVAATAIGATGNLVDLLGSTVYENKAGVYYLVLAPLEGVFLSITGATDPVSGPGEVVVVEPETPLPTDSALADCSRPVATGTGPLTTAMYIRGNYATGNNYAATPATHKLSYTGDNIYQVKITEAAGTSYSFKFASADWSHQFAVQGSAAVKVGSVQVMTTAAGPSTESAISIPTAGTYLYSFSVAASKTSGSMIVTKCP